MTASDIDISEFFSDPLADSVQQICNSEEDMQTLAQIDREMDKIRREFEEKMRRSLEISRNIVLDSTL